jgi:hypothetical protein
MHDGEFARPTLPVDLDLGDDSHHRTRALGIGDTAAGEGIIVARRGEGRGYHWARSARAGAALNFRELPAPPNSAACR